MTNKLNELKTIKLTLNSYLEYFPEEGSRLERLLNQIDADSEIGSRKNFNGHLTGSALVYNEKEDSVLLVHHKSLNLWIQPGGHLENGELPVEGALREFGEETSIKSARLHKWHHKQNIPLDVDTHYIPANPKKDEPEHFHHDFLYLLDTPSLSKSTFKINEEELKGYKWIALKELLDGGFEDKLKRTAKKVQKLIKC